MLHHSQSPRVSRASMPQTGASDCARARARSRVPAFASKTLELTWRRYSRSRWVRQTRASLPRPHPPPVRAEGMRASPAQRAALTLHAVSLWQQKCADKLGTTTVRMLAEHCGTMCCKHSRVCVRSRSRTARCGRSDIRTITRAPFLLAKTKTPVFACCGHGSCTRHAHKSCLVRGRMPPCSSSSTPHERRARHRNPSPLPEASTDSWEGAGPRARRCGAGAATIARPCGQLLAGILPVQPSRPGGAGLARRARATAAAVAPCPQPSVAIGRGARAAVPAPPLPGCGAAGDYDGGGGAGGQAGGAVRHALFLGYGDGL